MFGVVGIKLEVIPRFPFEFKCPLTVVFVKALGCCDFCRV